MADANKSKQLLEQIAQERAKGMQIRLGVSVLVVVFFSVFGFNVYNQVKSFDSDALLVELQSQATTLIWPMVSRELDSIAADAVPAITDAMANEAEALLPRLNDRFMSETEVFQNNMNTRMKNSIDSSIAAALEKHDDKIQEKLKDFNSESSEYDDLVRRLQASSQDWAEKTLDEIFQEHIMLLQSINESVQKLRGQALAERGDHADQNLDDVMMLLVEILNTRLNEEG